MQGLVAMAMGLFFFFVVVVVVVVLVTGALRARKCVFICSEHEVHVLNLFLQIPQVMLSGRSFVCGDAGRCL